MTEIQSWLFHWITEREKCREGNEAQLPKPWSSDPILQNYRFCNVRREDDKVTKWIKDNWRDKYPNHPNMVLAMVVARTVNWPDTLNDIKFPNWPRGSCRTWFEDARTAMKIRRTVGRKVWTGAYLVSTNGHSMDKVDYIIDRVWLPIYERCRNPHLGESLGSYHLELTKYDGMGSFMAAQVIADLKHTSFLNTAPDWHTWSAVGPGSRRGINRYQGHKLEAAISTTTYYQAIVGLQYAIRQNTGLDLHAQDVQNCMCEYDKYCRVKLNEGYPRSLYNGTHPILDQKTRRLL